MHIESQKVTADKSQQEMFEFLTNAENYEQLMPESKEKFEVRDEKTFVFGLKGMPVIKLQIRETIEPELVVLGSTSDKLDFSLKAHISALNENQSELFHKPELVSGFFIDYLRQATNWVNSQFLIHQFDLFKIESFKD